MEKTKKMPKVLGKISIWFILSFVFFVAGNMGAFIVMKSFVAQGSGASVLTDEQIQLAVIQNPLFLSLTSIGNILFIGALALFMKLVDKRSMKTMFKAPEGESNLVMILKGVAFGLVTIILFIGFGLGTHLFEYASEETISVFDSNMMLFLWSGLVFSFITGFYEEIFFRGYVLKELYDTNKKYALVISAVIFMLSELLSVAGPIDFLGLFLTGILFGYIYLSTKSIMITAGLHSTLHFFLISLVKFDKYDFGLPTLFTFISKGKIMLFGMPMGTTTGVCTVFINAFFLVVIYLYKKRRNSPDVQVSLNE